MLKVTAYILFLTTLFLSCQKDPAESLPKPSCNFTNYRYFGNVKDTLGDMSDRYLSVMFDPNYNETEVRKFLSTLNIFDLSYHNKYFKTFDSVGFTILKFNKPKTCEEITDIINNLQRSPLVTSANFTIKTDLCYTVFGNPAGNLCVIAYTNRFFVNVLDTTNLTNLYKTISSTNTVFAGKWKPFDGWYIIKVTNQSKGNAIQMANYFFESKLFQETEFDYGHYPVE